VECLSHNIPCPSRTGLDHDRASLLMTVSPLAEHAKVLPVKFSPLGRDMAYMLSARCKPVRTLGNRSSCGQGELFQHACVDPLMKRIKRIPVDHTPEAPWQKPGEELKFRPIFSEGIHAKLHHGLPGKLHLRQQLQVQRRIHVQDPPKIEGVADHQF